MFCAVGRLDRAGVFALDLEVGIVRSRKPSRRRPRLCPRAKQRQANQGRQVNRTTSHRQNSPPGMVGAAGDCSELGLFSAVRRAECKRREKDACKIQAFFGRTRRAAGPPGSVRLGARAASRPLAARPESPRLRDRPVRSLETRLRPEMLRRLPMKAQATARLMAWLGVGLVRGRIGRRPRSPPTRCFPTTPCCSRKSRCRCGARPTRPKRSRSASPARKSRRRPRTAAGRSNLAPLAAGGPHVLTINAGQRQNRNQERAGRRGLDLRRAVEHAVDAQAERRRQRRDRHLGQRQASAVHRAAQRIGQARRRTSTPNGWRAGPQHGRRFFGRGLFLRPRLAKATGRAGRPDRLELRRHGRRAVDEQGVDRIATRI